MTFQPTSALPIYTLFVWPDAAAELSQIGGRWFNWDWNGTTRIVVAHPEKEEENLALFQKWRGDGFIPLVVWRDRATPFWDRLLDADLGLIGVYLLDDDWLEVHELVCNPDSQLEDLWERLCGASLDRLPLGGPNTAEFWGAYADAFNSWLRRAPGRDQAGLTPKRLFGVSEFLSVPSRRGLFQHQSFPVARIQLTDDGRSVSQGALLELPALDGYSELTGDELSRAWYQALSKLNAPLAVSNLARPTAARFSSIRLRWPLTPAATPRALHASTHEAGPVQRVERQPFPLAGGTIRGQLAVIREAGGTRIDLSLESDAPAQVRLLLRDAQAEVSERQIDAALQDRGHGLAVWRQRLGVGSGSLGVDLVLDEQGAVLTVIYPESATEPEGG